MAILLYFEGAASFEAWITVATAPGSEMLVVITDRQTTDGFTLKISSLVHRLLRYAQ